MKELNRLKKERKEESELVENTHTQTKTHNPPPLHPAKKKKKKY